MSTQVILQGTNFTGDLEIDGDISINGTILGSVKADGKVTIGEFGIVKGNLSCLAAEVSGSIEGILVIENHLSIKRTAKINGDIYSGALVCLAGAEIAGKTNIGSDWKKELEYEQEGDF